MAIVALLAVPGCGTLPALPAADLMSSTPQVSGSSIELYTRTARGAHACWFASGGPLKGKYLYQAEADPPSRGGRAVITIHERDTNPAQPKGVKAFEVGFIPDGERADVEITTWKLPAALDERLRRDIARWNSGDVGCATNAGTASTWQLQNVDEPLKQPVSVPAKTRPKAP